MFFQAFYIIIFRQFEALDFEIPDEDNVWKWNVYLHNQDDLADASRQPSYRFGLDNSQSTYYLKTKHLTKESTKSRPCMKYKPTTCKEVEMHKKIEQLHNCRIPIYYTGQHLDEYIHWLHPCNKSITKKMASLIFENFNCSNSKIPCTQTHHYMNKVGSVFVKIDYTQQIKGCRFEYDRNETEIFEKNIKVSTQALIGQVGGIHGITLGWSIRNTFLERVIDMLGTFMHICKSAY